mgnify:CR=1 FL=1
MVAFTWEQLEKRHITESLRTLYKRFCREDEMTAERMEAMRDICYSYEVRTKVRGMKCVLVILQRILVFQQIFPEEEYYTALLRKNSLPRRFLESQGVEFFSGMEEQMIVYGRDEMETLYICPKKLLFHNSFYQVVQNLLEKEKKTKTMSFYTLILTEKPVSAKELFPTIRRLIYILDHRLIIGKNQTIEIGLQGEKKEQKTETQMQEEKLNSR